MKTYNRLNKKEVIFLEVFNSDFHKAMDILIEQVNGPKIDDPKFWELKTEINKLKNKLEKLQEFVDSKSGDY